MKEDLEILKALLETIAKKHNIFYLDITTFNDTTDSQTILTYQKDKEIIKFENL